MEKNALWVLALLTACSEASTTVTPFASAEAWAKGAVGAKIEIMEFSRHPTIPIRYVARIEATNEGGLSLIKTLDRARMEARKLGVDGLAIQYMAAPAREARIADLEQPWVVKHTSGSRRVVALAFVYTDGRKAAGTSCSDASECSAEGSEAGEPGPDYDLSRAVVLFERACELGDKDACAKTVALRKLFY